MEKALIFEEFMGLSLSTFEKFGSKSQTSPTRRPIMFWSSMAVMLVSWLIVRTFATDTQEAGFTFLSVIHDLTGFIVQGSFMVNGFSLLFLHHSRIQQCVGKLRDLFPKTLKDQEKFGIQAQWEPMRFKNICFLKFYTFNFVIFTLLPLVATLHRKFLGDGVYEMLLPVQFRLEIDFDRPFVREVCYIFVTVNNLITFAFSTTFDTLFVSILSALCMQFDILNLKIQELDFRKSEVCEMFKTLVDDHQLLIELSDLVANIFSTTLFIDFVCGTITVCFLGFEIIVSLFKLFTCFFFF